MSILKAQNSFSPAIAISYVLTSEVDSFIVNENNNSVSITLNAGEVWKNIYSSRIAIDIEDKPKKDDAGILYNQKISLNNPGDDNIIAANINFLISKDLIIKIYYANGLTKIMGEPDIPAFLLSFHNTQNLLTNTSYTVTCSNTHPLLIDLS